MNSPSNGLHNVEYIVETYGKKAVDVYRYYTARRDRAEHIIASLYISPVQLLLLDDMIKYDSVMLGLQGIAFRSMERRYNHGR